MSPHHVSLQVQKLRTESMDVAFKVGRPRFGSVDSTDFGGGSRGNSFSAGGAAGADDLAAASVPPHPSSRGAAGVFPEGAGPSSVCTLMSGQT